jgi:LuxR family maltose regulon positive regulatory protein
MVLATKFFLPAKSANLIPRHTLNPVIRDAWKSHKSFILISAPPGYGKSTLLAEWIREDDIPAAWVSLDENDNESARFLQVLVLAIKPYLPAIESILTILNGPQQAAPENLMTEIINQLIHLQSSLLLVLDDYQVIQHALVHQMMQFLLDHQPPLLTIAILTRSDPPFTLARMRARRQLLEIRQNDLSFSDEESRQLLQTGLPIPLSEHQLKELTKRTEGWAVGLHLASISLKKHNDPANFIEQFSGSHRFVMDYLTSEVLANLPADLREFICKTAVLKQFTAPMINEILDLQNSQDFLTQVESMNLFLIPLDENRRWYRYHHLIASLFQAEVSLDEIQEIKRRAALWFDAQQNPIEAIQLAFESNYLELACQLIQKSVIRVAESGQLTTALNWLDKLPEGILLQHMDLCIIRIWLLIYNGRFQQAFQAIQKLESSDETERQPMDIPLQGMLLGIKAWSQTLSGQKMDLKNLQRAHEMMGTNYAFFSPLLLLALGQAQKESHLIDQARQSFEQGVAMTEKSENPVTNLILRNNLVFLLNAIGQCQAALQLCKEGITRHSDPEGSPSLLAGIPMIAYGCLLYQNGDLEQSEIILTKSIHLVRRLGLTEVLASPATQILQFLYCDQGRYDEALALNLDTRQQALKAGMMASVAFSDLLQAWISYWQGNRTLVLNWIEKHPLEAINPQETTHLYTIIIHARFLADSGKSDQALPLLQTLEKTILSTERLLDWIQIKLNQAIILQQAGKLKDAILAFITALEKADAIHFRQIFIQERKSILPLIQAIPQPVPHWLLEENPAFPREKSNPQILISPPSEREMEILRLVSSGLSNAEIADRLFITVGTTKWHLNHIYAKLGATRRTEAIVKAREYGLF